MAYPVRKGFTLVELVVVILVLGILAGVAAPRVMAVGDDASLSAAAAHIQVIVDAAQLCHVETGEWPSNQNGGVLPPELAPYLRDNPFASPCPIGGVYDWDRDNGGHRARLKIYGLPGNISQQEALDKLIDDGDLSTGSFLGLRPTAVVYVVEK